MRKLLLSVGLIATLSFGVTTEELSNYEKVANQGNTDAQSNLGKMYNEGYGVEIDKKKATYWYERAANKGNIEAQNTLGYIYLQKENYKEAFYWYKKASD